MYLHELHAFKIFSIEMSLSLVNRQQCCEVIVKPNGLCRFKNDSKGEAFI